MKFAIPVPSGLIRTIKDPFLDETRIIHAYPRAIDLIGDIPLTPDPRKPKDASPIVKKISQSLETNNGMFHLLNRGITISVFDAEYNSKTEVLTLNLPEDEDFDKYGVIDGGHTYKTLSTVVDRVRKDVRDALDFDAPLSNQRVHLEVMVKVQEHLADIAEARNFSVSLKSWTLAGYRDQFDWFLDALGPKYAQYIKISENDPPPVGILDLIQVMCAVNPVLFPNGEPALEAYKNAGKCLDYFIDKDDKYCFHRLKNISQDIVRLYDHIRFTWKTAYNAKDEAGKRGALGARTEMHKRQRNRTAMATYYFLDPENGPVIGSRVEGNEDYPVEKGFAIPAISSMRPLLILGEDNQYHWYTNPFEFWDKHGTKLVRMIMTASEGVGYNPHTVGRSSPVYSSLYTAVRNDLLEHFFAKQGQTIPF